MAKKIINCTPHAVTVLDPSNCVFSPKTSSYTVDGTPIVRSVFPPQEPIPRCAEQEQLLEKIDGIDILKIQYGDVKNLPEPQQGTYCIVSNLVAEACPERDDLVIPVRLVRDSEGKIIACLAFACLKTTNN